MPRYSFQPLQNTILKLATSAESELDGAVDHDLLERQLRLQGGEPNQGQPAGRCGSAIKPPIYEVNQTLIRVASITKWNLSK